MKKNVIAVILSIVIAVGSIGTAVPVFAAEEGTTAETAVENGDEEIPEDVSGEEDSGENAEEVSQSDSDVDGTDAADDGNAYIEEDISDDGSDQVSDSQNPASETEEESVPDMDMQDADEEAVDESQDAAAKAGTIASGTCGANLTWVLDGEGKLTISGTGAMDDFDGHYEDYDYSCNSPWFGHRESVRSIDFPSGITHIGNFAFFGCGNLNEITIPEGVTSLGYCMIMDTSIANILIPKNVSSCNVYEYFNSKSGPLGGSNVKKVEFQKGMKTIPDNICIGGHFVQQFQKIPTPATIVEEVVIPDSVTTIGTSAFAYCEMMSEIKIPSSVTTISGGAFYTCTSLSKATLEFDTEESRNGYTGLTIGNGAFTACASLSEQNLTENAVSIGSTVFWNCGSLTEVISNAKTVGNEVFVLDNNLKTVVFNNVKSLGASLFGYNSGSDSPNWPGKVSEVKFRGNAPTFDENTFSGCTLTAYYPESNRTWTKSVLQNYGGTITWVPWSGYQQNDISGANVTLKDVFQDDEGNNCCVYTGAQIKPGILEVRLGDKLLVEGTNYTVEYGPNLDYGEGTVTIKGMGDYEGEQTVKFLIVPEKVTGLKGNNDLSTDIVAYTNYRRGLDLTWDKQNAKGIKYEIQYAKTSGFSKKETVTVSDNKYSDLEKPLERKTDYYVRVRANLKVNGKTINGQWSDILTVKSGGQILASEMWGFGNYEPTISIYDYQDIFKDERGFARAAFEYDYKYETKKDPSTAHEAGYKYKCNGVCYGMVLAAAAYYDYNTPSVGSYPELSSITESMRPEICSSDYSSALKLERTIIYAHLVQYAYEAFKEMQSNDKNMYGLYKAVKDCECGNGRPVIIHIKTRVIYQKEDGEVIGGAHTLIAEGIKEETGDNVVIEVYDPIRSTTPNELILYKNASGEFESWMMYFNDKGNFRGTIEDLAEDNYIIYTVAEPELVANTLDQLNSQGFASNETARYFLAQIESNDSGALNFVESSAESQGGIPVTKENVLSGEGSIQSAAYFFEKDSIDIPPVPAGCTLTFANGNHFARVSPSAVSDVHLKVLDSKSSEITVTPHGKGKCTITLFDAESMPSNYDEITTIEGDVVSGKNIRIGQEGNSINITGMDSVSISKTGGNEDEHGGISEDLVISVGADLDLGKSYRFTHDDDRAKIVQDKDGNGTYETVITESEVETSGSKIIASGTCGKNLTWKLNNEGTLVISGTGKMEDYSQSPFSSYDVKKVIIENGVTSIGDTAFYFCESLTSVTIPKNVTYIGNYAFSYCNNLTSIKIPDSVKEIGPWAFHGCRSLTSITIPASVKSINQGVFEGCRSLTSIKIPDSVTDISDFAFSRCSSLTSIKIPYGIKRIEQETFEGCSSLTNVTIPSSVTYIGWGAFYGCSSLTNITIPNSVTNISSSAFENCGCLESIIIPDGVLYIYSYTFEDCVNLKKITLPRNIKAIEKNSFLNCSKLKATVKNKCGLTYCRDNGISYIDRSAIEIKLTSYNGSDFRVNITKRDDASGYQIKYADNSSMTNAKSVMLKGSNNLSKVITGLKNGKTYYVKIQSYQTINGTTYWSNWSPAKSIKITQTPYNTNVSKLSTYIGSHIKVDWTKTAGASGYHIKYADNSSMTGAKEVMVKGNSTFTKTLTGLKNGKTYYVKIQTYRTVSGKTYWSSWSPAKSIKVDQKPYGSSISKLTNPSSKAMKITWDKAPSATGYHIQYSTNSNMSGSKDIMVNNKDTLSKTVTGLTKGKTYYVRIQTFRKVSGKTYWSSWSKAKQIKISK